MMTIALRLALVSTLGTFALGCSKKEDSPGKAALPETPSAESVCKRLEAQKLAKNCRKGSGTPNGMSEKEMSGVAEFWSFDATFFEGRTFPGDVIRFKTASDHAGARVTFGIAKEFAVFTEPNAVHVQAKRKDGDPGYEKTVQLVRSAMPG